MFDIDSFFKKHGANILRFDIKIGGVVDRLEFSRDFLLGPDRTNPFALQERNDEASSKTATYGTLFIAAKYAFKEKQQEFDFWYAGVHREVKAALIKEISDSTLGYQLKKAPTSEDVENAVMNSSYGVELKARQVALDADEKTMDQMEILYKAAGLDADVARTMSSMGGKMLERGMISDGQPRQPKPDAPKKTPNDDSEF